MTAATQIALPGVETQPPTPGTGLPPLTVRVLALDLAYSTTGVALVGDDTIRLSLIRTATGGHDAIDDIHRRITALIGDFRPDLAIVEGVYAGPNGRTGLLLAELHGVIKHQLWRSRIPYVVVKPTDRAMYASGSGNACKELVLAQVRARYGHLVGGPAEIRDDNMADALVLAAMAYDQLGRPLVPVPDAMRRALGRLSWRPVRSGRRPNGS